MAKSIYDELRDIMTKDLKPNANPPQDKEELLRELERLGQYFCEASIDYSNALDAVRSVPSKEPGGLYMVGFFIVVGFFLSSLYNAVFHGQFVDLVGICILGFLYYYCTEIYPKNRKAKKAYALAHKFRQAYLNAERNFVSIEDIVDNDFLVCSRDIIRNGYAETYDVAKQYYLWAKDQQTKQYRIEAERRRNEYGKIENKAKFNGTRILCSYCGTVFYALNIGAMCPVCGRRSDTTVGKE